MRIILSSIPIMCRLIPLLLLYSLLLYKLILLLLLLFYLSQNTTSPPTRWFSPFPMSARRDFTKSRLRKPRSRAEGGGRGDRLLDRYRHMHVHIPLSLSLSSMPRPHSWLVAAPTSLRRETLHSNAGTNGVKAAPLPVVSGGGRRRGVASRQVGGHGHLELSICHFIQSR